MCWFVSGFCSCVCSLCMCAYVSLLFYNDRLTKVIIEMLATRAFCCLKQHISKEEVDQINWNIFEGQYQFVKKNVFSIIINHNIYGLLVVYSVYTMKSHTNHPWFLSKPTCWNVFGLVGWAKEQHVDCTIQLSGRWESPLSFSVIWLNVVYV